MFLFMTYDTIAPFPHAAGRYDGLFSVEGTADLSDKGNA